MAYLVAWVTWGVGALFFELAVLGPRLTLIKRLTTLIFPLLAGFIAQFVASIIKP